MKTGSLTIPDSITVVVTCLLSMTVLVTCLGTCTVLVTCCGTMVVSYTWVQAAKKRREEKDTQKRGGDE